MKPQEHGRPPQGDTLDETIVHVERLYRTLTGRDAPPVGDAPFAPIPPERDAEQHVGEQVDQLLKRLERFASQLDTPQWAPLVSIVEAEQEVRVYADVPGVSRDEIEARLVAPSALEITGTRQARREQNGSHARVRQAEQPRGRFRRLVPLPFAVDPDEMTARLRDGELEIRLKRVATPAADTQTIRGE